MKRAPNESGEDRSLPDMESISEIPPRSGAQGRHVTIRNAHCKYWILAVN